MRTIQLSPEEEKLYHDACSIDFNEDYEIRIRKLNSSAQLMKMLLDRNAIPPQRIKIFTDKEYRLGRHNRSVKEEFEGNGNVGIEIFKHGHFLKYLRYFVSGANLDSSLIDAVDQIVRGNTYADDTVKEIFEFVRANRLIPKDDNLRNIFSEELFKLVVDLGMEVYYCHQLRHKVRG